MTPKAPDAPEEPPTVEGPGLLVAEEGAAAEPEEPPPPSPPKSTAEEPAVEEPPAAKAKARGQGRREAGKSERLARIAVERAQTLQRVQAEEQGGGIDRSVFTTGPAKSGANRVNAAKRRAHTADWKAQRAASYGGELTRLKWENAVRMSGTRARKHARAAVGATAASIAAAGEAAKAERRARFGEYKPREREPMPICLLGALALRARQPRNKRRRKLSKKPAARNDAEQAASRVSQEERASAEHDKRGRKTSKKPAACNDAEQAASRVSHEERASAEPVKRRRMTSKKPAACYDAEPAASRASHEQRTSAEHAPRSEPRAERAASRASHERASEPEQVRKKPAARVAIALPAGAEVPADTPEVEVYPPDSNYAAAVMSRRAYARRAIARGAAWGERRRKQKRRATLARATAARSTLAGGASESPSASS